MVVVHEMRGAQSIISIQERKDICFFFLKKENCLLLLLLLLFDF